MQHCQREEGTGSPLRTQTRYERTLGEEPARPRLTAGRAFSTVARGQSRHCGVSAAGTDPWAAAPQRAYGKQPKQFCTEKSDGDGLGSGFAWNREKCGADVTTSPMKDFSEGINLATTGGAKIRL